MLNFIFFLSGLSNHKIDFEFFKIKTPQHKNLNNYHVLQILHPYFGFIAGKSVIESFIHLKIIWLLKLVESFEGDVGAEVMFQISYS